MSVKDIDFRDYKAYFPTKMLFLRNLRCTGTPCSSCSTTKCEFHSLALNSFKYRIKLRTK